MTECNELTRYVMRSHAGFDADEAWRNVRKSCGDPGTGDLFAQYDRAFLIQANHMQRVLTGIDTNGACNCGVCFARHGMCSSCS